MKILETITWGQYLIGVGSMIFLYYIVILFYSWQKTARVKKLGDDTRLDENPPSQERADDESDEANLMEQLENIVNEIRYGILEAGKSATKAELLDRIAMHVANYDGLRRPAYRYALNNFIIKHAEEVCRVSYTEEELEQTWDSLQG